VEAEVVELAAEVVGVVLEEQAVEVLEAVGIPPEP
jgi:hypothetical protein